MNNNFTGGLMPLDDNEAQPGRPGVQGDATSEQSPVFRVRTTVDLSAFSEDNNLEDGAHLAPDEDIELDPIEMEDLMSQDIDTQWARTLEDYYPAQWYADEKTGMYGVEGEAAPQWAVDLNLAWPVHVSALMDRVIMIYNDPTFEQCSALASAYSSEPRLRNLVIDLLPETPNFQDIMPLAIAIAGVDGSYFHQAHGVAMLLQIGMLEEARSFFFGVYQAVDHLSDGAKIAGSQFLVPLSLLLHKWQSDEVFEKTLISLTFSPADAQDILKDTIRLANENTARRASDTTTSLWI